MAGFRKAKVKKLPLKMTIYGPQGSGKTFTALLFAEGLAKLSGTRIAFIDTEGGSNYYGDTDVPVDKRRKIHPEPFDFDVLETKSITEASYNVSRLKPAEHGIIIVDSMSHLWEAAIAAYTGTKTKAGTIPMDAWGPLKKPYKQFISLLMNAPQHVIILGRQSLSFGVDDDGKTEAQGYKMKAEGETPYETHVCARMEQQRGADRLNVQIIFEKDRTGVHAGRIVSNPNFDSIIKPWLPFLGGDAANIPTIDDAALADAEAMTESRVKKNAASTKMFEDFEFRMKRAETADALEAISKELTPEVKRQMIGDHVDALRELYAEKTTTLKG